ncbi:thiamine phosphate synthase [Clostridium rectalis]|uniref:thiamine phosphate synthase n=1 Tax=Clostridium rectalis TaxID=2040295 RepID=UPI001FAA4E40|nr:thiamine phosphate synthase [Clostridium rectalis]
MNKNERVFCKNNIDYSLYLVTDRTILKEKNLEKAIEEAILGGVTLVQLREKDIDTRNLFEISKKVKKITDRYNIPLIINDRIDVALAVDAGGVHVGQSDMPADVVRKIIGDEKIVGVSVGNLKEAKDAKKQGADYLGVGAIFSTSTKKDAKSVSLDELIKIRANVEIPIVAIGGINQYNVNNLKNTNIDGISVISAILGRENVKKAAEELKGVLKEF